MKHAVFALCWRAYMVEPREYVDCFASFEGMIDESDLNEATLLRIKDTIRPKPMKWKIFAVPESEKQTVEKQLGITRLQDIYDSIVIDTKRSM